MTARVIERGCILDWADTRDELATQNNLIADICFREGCMSEWADNYDVLATTNDSSCYREGCMVDYMDNYDLLATHDSKISVTEWVVLQIGLIITIIMLQLMMEVVIEPVAKTYGVGTLV